MFAAKVWSKNRAVALLLVVLAAFAALFLSDCPKTAGPAPYDSGVCSEALCGKGLSSGEALYGKALPWKEADVLFPRFTSAIVRDVETGRALEVERRGGTYHADVQPLTAKDTQVLKEIYANEWSWRRRAITVEAGMERIAASMHGMPHGSGKIKGNDFPGHFCIHFLNSRVHGSGKADPAHQMMIWKAAGQPGRLFDEAGPLEVLNLVFVALNQKDTGLAALGLYAARGEDIWLSWHNMCGKLPRFTVRGVTEIASAATDTRKKYNVRLELLYPGKPKKEVTAGLCVIRERTGGRWLLEAAGLVEVRNSTLGSQPLSKAEISKEGD